uniref:MULE transposase domain-containing protein n=1 Tax=Panagrolaimus superbus TaxID=310955 RepID=A0A914ZF43_9BILA
MEDALKLPSHERYDQLKKIVESPSYKEIQESGIVYVDTTFNLSSLHLTLAMFSSPHLLRDKKPALFTGCYMLSSKKDARAYEFMAKCIDKYVLPNGKIFRAIVTDADGALNLQCMIHLRKNIVVLCDEHVGHVINDIFGYVYGEVRYKGLLDEITFPEFEQKLIYLQKLSHWVANPRLLEWFKKGFKKQKLFQRYGLVNRLKAGLGFAESQTNGVEGENMNLKDGIDDYTPVQALIKKLEKRSHGKITKPK